MRTDTQPNHATFPTATHVPKSWGAEHWLFNGPDFCAKFLDFTAGSQGSLHWHRDKHEAWRILSGEIQFTWVDTATAT